MRKLRSKSFLCICLWPKCSIFETRSSSNDKSVYLPTHFAIASAPKPTLCTSIVSIFFGLPLAGKCIKTGAEFNFMVCNEIKKLNKYQNAKIYLLGKPYSFIQGGNLLTICWVSYVHNYLIFSWWRNQMNLLVYEKATKFQKISHLFWQ